MRLSMLLYNKIVPKETEDCESKRTPKRNHWCLELLCQILKLILAVKIFMIFQYVFKSTDEKTEPIALESGLGQVYNEGYGYNILNQRNVTFILRPAPCGADTKLVLMVSSGPGNSVLRNLWRRAVYSHHPGAAQIQLVFVVAEARSAGQQQELLREHQTFGDIVQSSVADGHRLLAYKILMGYVWTYNECRHVPYVAKTDDNVVMNVTRLLSILRTREAKDVNKWFIACSVPSRNIATGRLTRPNMRGNWSLTKDQLDADILPDFCSGFLYVTRPEVGAGLAQAGLEMYRDSEDVVITEDYLIAGVLREKIQGVDVETLRSDHFTDWVWQRYLSHCPWLVTTRQTFFDDLILSKKSSRNNVQYVGSLTNWRVWRFFLCLHFEALLEIAETKVPGSVPDYIWDMCTR